jgi:hypothetical protein
MCDVTEDGFAFFFYPFQYANSIYSIAIASVNGDGRKADYSEEGAPLVVSATSSPPYVTTTGVKGGCEYVLRHTPFASATLSLTRRTAEGSAAPQPRLP